MKKIAKIKGSPDIVRDMETKAIVNIDRQSLLKAKARKTEKLEQQNRIYKLETDVNDISEKMDKILELLSRNS